MMARRRDYKFEDNHHILPTSRGGTNAQSNLVRMRRNIHEALHKLFENDTPMEQYGKLVELNQSVHTKDFLEAIHEVLSWTPDEVYLEEVIDMSDGYYVDGIYRLGMHESEDNLFSNIRRYKNGKKY